MATPLYRVRVGWEGRNAGVAVVGSAIVGVSQVGHPFTPVFTGPYDTIADDSDPDVDSRLDSYTINRGADPGDASFIQAGTLTMTLLDLDGDYNPSNPSSPLAGLVRPMRPVSFETSIDDGATWIGRFYGWITTPVPDSASRTCTITAQDFYIWLNSDYCPVIPSTGPTTTGAAIKLVLAAYGWTNESMMDIDDGDVIPDFSADGTQNGVALISNLLTAERGRFYQRGDGVIRYESRNADAIKSVVVDLSGLISAVSPGTDLANIINLQYVTRTGGGAQGYSDNASDKEFGTRGGQNASIESPYLMGDSTGASNAFGLARYIVNRAKDPVAVLWSMTLVSADDELMAAQQQIELGDRVTVAEDGFNTSGDFHVLKITEQYISGAATVTSSWALKARGVQAAIVGRSVVGGSDVVTY